MPLGPEQDQTISERDDAVVARVLGGFGERPLGDELVSGLVENAAPDLRPGARGRLDDVPGDDEAARVGGDGGGVRVLGVELDDLGGVTEVEVEAAEAEGTSLAVRAVE